MKAEVVIYNKHGNLLERCEVEASLLSDIKDKALHFFISCPDDEKDWYEIKEVGE
jgi:hypothetical protein